MKFQLEYTSNLNQDILFKYFTGWISKNCHLLLRLITSSSLRARLYISISSIDPLKLYSMGANAGSQPRKVFSSSGSIISKYRNKKRGLLSKSFHGELDPIAAYIHLNYLDLHVLVDLDDVVGILDKAIGQL